MATSRAAPLANPGDRFGPYEIVAAVGAGGMGRVYKARDPKLGRFVAIKVLSPDTHGDPDRLRRFEQEARAASALNHPNILTIYETGEIEGAFYIAMEFVEGETLREALGGGALSSRRLFDTAIQIAEGLAKAHAAGIVHRDLKPENVMLTGDGYVKILDFGLAKLIDPLDEESRSLTETISASNTATRPGTLLGTVSYMSPEQARGERTDFRSDIFSFGSLLYEMAAGRRAFRGRSPVDTLSQILNENPQPLPEIAPDAAASLVWIVEKCLAKEPAQRYQSTRDLAIDLKKAREELAVSSSGARLAPRPSRERRRRGDRYSRRAAAALGIAALLAAAYWLGREAGVPPPDELTSDLVRLTRDGAMNRRPAVSPDGKSFVFESSREGSPHLYLQYFAGGSPTRVTREGGDVTESYAAWSPDGSQIAYQRESSRETQIAITAPVGGRPVILIARARWPAWSRDGRELYFVRPGKEGAPAELRGHPLSGGEEWPVCRLTEQDGPPAVSPDGRWVSFVRSGMQDEYRPGVYLAPLPSGGPRRILAVRAVTPRTRIAWFPDSFRFVVARDNGSDEGANLWVADRRGRISRRLTNASAHFFNPALSSDGSLLLCDPYEEYETLWKIPLRGTAEENSQLARRLTLGRVSETDPDLSPDQQRVVFTSNRDGALKLWIFDLASGETRPLEYGSADSFCGSFSPSGRLIAFFSKRSGKSALWTMSAEGSEAVLREQSLHYSDPSGSFARSSPVWVSEEEVAFDAEAVAGRRNLYLLSFKEGRPRLLERDASSPVRSATGGLAAVAWPARGSPRVRVYDGGAGRDLAAADSLLADPSTIFWRFSRDGESFLYLRSGPAARSGIGYDLFQEQGRTGSSRPLTRFATGGLEYQFCVARDESFAIGTREEAIADIVRIQHPLEKGRR